MSLDLISRLLARELSSGCVPEVGVLAPTRPTTRDMPQLLRGWSCVVIDICVLNVSFRGVCVAGRFGPPANRLSIIMRRFPSPALAIVSPADPTLCAVTPCPTRRVSHHRIEFSGER